MKKEIEERPKIKDYFGEEATLDSVAKTYTDSPELFKYAQSLDNYIAKFEQSHQKLKDAL